MTRQLRELKLGGALTSLLEAYEYSEETKQDSWYFALEVEQLRLLGLNNSDLRWLSSMGYVVHRVETTPFGEHERTFHSAGRFNFEERSCFVLTAEGISAARSLGRKILNSAQHEATQPATSQNGDAAVPHRQGDPEGHPVWDNERRELRLDGKVVKQFKRPAVNQEAILAAFEEDRWPACISDPIPQHPDIDTKRRLNDAIKSLNRHQSAQILRFKGDGTAEGIVWERVHQNGHREQ